MKRLGRWLLDGLALLSLLLCVAASAAWVRSALRRDSIRSWHGQFDGRGAYRYAEWRVQSCNGGLGVGWTTVDVPADRVAAHRQVWPEHFAPGREVRSDADIAGLYPYAGLPQNREWHGWGAGEQRLVVSGTASLVERWLVVPYWAILLAAAAWLAGLLAARRRARQRRVAGRCASCGYDLRATPSRCPECGTIAAGDRA